MALVRSSEEDAYFRNDSMTVAQSVSESSFDAVR